jgi:S-formylglutathione hydrolase FrmB
MGGYGALVLSMHHPHLFTACVALSAAVRTDEQIMQLDSAGYERRFGHIYGHNLKGQSRLTTAYRKNSILDMAKNLPAEELKKVSYYLDCGDDDFLTEGNALLHVQLTRAGIPHEYRSRNGAHTWSYWRTGIVDGWKFIGNSFHR